ncbi:MAG: hypothetical protein K0R75_3091 [Paenibacillaceae bacterium]|jgi:hypothetical protein|nr:hypothetical protein [Paenibacillaceae bacterium]
MAKSDELVKYITQRVVEYIDTPKEVRRENKQAVKTREREPGLQRWFGMIPDSIRIWLQQRKK